MKTLFINRSPSRELLLDVAANALATMMAQIIAERGTCRLALAGGSTMRGLYQRWARAQRDGLDWRKVEIFFSDERCVGPDAEASNYRMVRETLLDHVAVETIHRMHGELAPDEALDRYSALIEARGPLDLTLLGMGNDGHIASLFADTPGLMTRAPVVHTMSPTPPVDRLSLSLATLNRSRRVVLLVSGAPKAQRLAQVYAQAVGGAPRILPAAMLAPRSGDLMWLVDTAAAADLPEGAPDVMR